MRGKGEMSRVSWLCGVIAFIAGFYEPNGFIPVWAIDVFPLAAHEPKRSPMWQTKNIYIVDSSPQVDIHDPWPQIIEFCKGLIKSDLLGRHNDGFALSASQGKALYRREGLDSPSEPNLRVFRHGSPEIFNNNLSFPGITGGRTLYSNAFDANIGTQLSFGRVLGTNDKFLGGPPQAGGIESQEERNDSERNRGPSHPPIKRRFLFFLFSFSLGYFLIVFGWNNIDNQRAVSSSKCNG